MFLQVAVSFARTEQDAAAAAYEHWRHCAVSAEQLADLPTPAAFDRASLDSDPGDVLSKVRASSDIQRHIEWLYEDCALGFERIYLHNVASQHQERFIEACAMRVIPSVSQDRGAS
jgi:coenzyme F420-dependent glucose-6-phosphate dehydrogenase